MNEEVKYHLLTPPPNIKYSGSVTEQNLLMAFAAECQASIRYSFFASVAKKSGFEQIAEVFAETSAVEKEHAKIWFKELMLLGDTSENLRTAAKSEHKEWSAMYQAFAEQAWEDGYSELAQKFRQVADIESFHEGRFRRFLDTVESDTVFSRCGETYWYCRNCGHIEKGTEAPEKCPVCNHPQAFYEELTCVNKI